MLLLLIASLGLTFGVLGGQGYFQWMHPRDNQDNINSQGNKSTVDAVSDLVSNVTSAFTNFTSPHVPSFAKSLLNKTTEWTGPSSLNSPSPQFRVYDTEYLLALDIPGINLDELSLVRHSLVSDNDNDRIKEKEAESEGEEHWMAKQPPSTLHLIGKHALCLEEQPPSIHPPNMTTSTASSNPLFRHRSPSILHWCLERHVEHSMPIPKDVKLEDIEAVLREGVLVIRMPRKQFRKSKTEKGKDEPIKVHDESTWTKRMVHRLGLAE